MTKTFIFLRGLRCEFKEQVAQALMAHLNPTVNRVSAIRIDMASYITDWSAKDQIKAADSSAKKLVKRLLLNGAERYLVITNESLIPQHWQPYYALSQDIAPNAIAIGIDVEPDEKLLDPSETQKLNLQHQNCEVFKASVYKYSRIKSQDDLALGFNWI